MDADRFQEKGSPAGTAPGQNAVKKVTGKVFLDKSGVGVPDLLVTVCDVDLETVPEEAIRTGRGGVSLPDVWEQLHGKRIGAVRTDEKGEFVLEYGDEAPNLALFVTGPEGGDLESPSPVLHVSYGIRQNAGRAESYLIRVAPDQLAQAGVPLPSASADEVANAKWPGQFPGGPPTSEEAEDVPPRAPSTINEHVSAVSTALRAEREAAASIRTVLAEEVSARTAEEERVRSVVNGVLANLAHSGGGDLRWKVLGNASIASLTAAAVVEARSTMTATPPAVLAKPGSLGDGESLSTRELMTRLSGMRPPRDGYRRADPVERMRRRERYVTADGLPRPVEPSSTPNGHVPESQLRSGDPEGDAIESSVNEKVHQLIEAMRLPEDPPLLVAEGALKGTGADVEFARGIADVTAFHDFHELVLAMPSVWQEVFDERFVSVIDATVRSLEAAGLPVDDLLDATQDGPEPAQRLLRRCRELQVIYDTTSAARIRPAVTSRVRAPAAIARSVSDARGMVLRRDDDRLPGEWDSFEPPGFRAGTPHPEFEEAARNENQGGLGGLLGELESYLRGKHSFTIFAANGAERAINFGVLLTWRQLWKPLTYQAGEIVHTITLAPGEERTIVMKNRRTLKRVAAEARKSQNRRTLETTDTNRAESEILRKATASTNFHLSTTGSTKLLVSDGSFTSTATRDVGRDNNDTRRRFREAVMKAAQEYHEEQSWEVKTESEEVSEEETTAKFRNPNDEIVLNAVFYSLQRRYQVHEHLYRARPVIMVAMPVPDPAEITAAWLIRHAWILKRSLLDDRFTLALDYLTTSYLGDKEVLSNLQASVVEHTKVLKEARYRMAEARALVELRSSKLSDVRRSVARGDTKGVFEQLGDMVVPGVQFAKDALDFASGLFGGGDDDDEKQRRAAALVEAAEEEAIRAEREAREAEIQVTGATSALQQATRDYVQAKREALNHEVRIAEARIHFSDHILHYQRAILESQPTDQMFFELHVVQVPVLGDSVRLVRQGSLDEPGLGGFTPERFRAEFAAGDAPLTFQPLAEVADLHQLLGFKGNFAIFPMKEGNALTDLILAPYLDQHEILRDPDDIAASWTLPELQEYADGLRARVAAGEITSQEFDEVHAPFLRATLERLITEPQPSEELVIAPANAVFAELLTSGSSLVEPFKKEHRALDVAKVRAEVRQQELDNARRAALIAIGQLDDPEIDKRIVVQREPGIVVTEEATG